MGIIYLKRDLAGNAEIDPSPGNAVDDPEREFFPAEAFERYATVRDRGQFLDFPLGRSCVSVQANLLPEGMAPREEMEVAKTLHRLPAGPPPDIGRLALLPNIRESFRRVRASEFPIPVSEESHIPA